MIYLIMILSVLLGCAANKDVKQNNGSDSSTEVEEKSWDFATWEECNQWVGSHPCNFQLMNQYGETTYLYDYHEKVIVVDLSTMWCGYCQNIATKPDEYIEKYGADNFIWLTLLVEDYEGNKADIKDLEIWSSLNNITSPVLAAGDIIDMSGQNGYPASAWPTIVLINKEMIVSKAAVGWNEQIVQAWIEELLAE